MGEGTKLIPASKMEEEEPYVMMYFLPQEQRRAVSEAEVLDSRVWSRLPRELLERVLLFLPATAQVELRHVCKGFRSLVDSSRFREESATSGLACCAGTVCFVMLHLGSAGASSSVKGGNVLRRRACASVHNVRVDLGFLPAKFRSAASLLSSSLVPYVCHSGNRGDGSRGDGGLVCIRDAGNKECLSLCVTNLANRSWRELPPVSLPSALLTSSIRVVGEKGAPWGFQVCVTFFSGSDNRPIRGFARYSSSTGAWTRCEGLDLGARNRWNGFAVCKGGEFHLLAKNSGSRQDVSLVTFSGDDASLVRRLPNVATNNHQLNGLLFEYGERLLWFDWSLAKCTITIWDSMKERVHLAALPLAGLLPHNVMLYSVDLVRAQLANDMIFFVLLYTVLEQEMERSGCIFAYHLVENSWQHFLTDWLPTDFGRTDCTIAESRPGLYV